MEMYDETDSHIVETVSANIIMNNCDHKLSGLTGHSAAIVPVHGAIAPFSRQIDPLATVSVVFHSVLFV